MKRWGGIAAIWLLCGAGLLVAQTQPEDKNAPATPPGASATPQPRRPRPPRDTKGGPGSRPGQRPPGRPPGPPPPGSRQLQGNPLLGPPPGSRQPPGNPLLGPPDPRQSQKDRMLGPLGHPGDFRPPNMPPPPGHRHPMPPWPGGPLMGFLFMLAEKPLEEQQKILQASPRFRAMTPMQQQDVRLNLRRMTAMTPQERRLFQERFEIFHSLPFSARETIRTEIFPAWNRMGPRRRQMVLQEFRRLARMRPGQRNSRFVQDTFVQQFSNDEQKVLRQMLALAPAPPPPSLARKP